MKHVFSNGCIIAAALSRRQQFWRCANRLMTNCSGQKFGNEVFWWNYPLHFLLILRGSTSKLHLVAIPARSLLVNYLPQWKNKLTEPIKLAHVWKDVLMIKVIGGKPIIWICWIWWQPVTFSAHGKPKHSSQIIDATSNACIKNQIPNLSYKTNLTFLRLKTN